MQKINKQGEYLEPVLQTIDVQLAYEAQTSCFKNSYASMS